MMMMGGKVGAVGSEMTDAEEGHDVLARALVSAAVVAVLV
jgi:hypothetical protein